MLTKEELINVLMENILYQVITGSTSYGLNTKDSDVDEKCVASLPKEHIFTLGQDFETLSLHDPKDYEIHSLKKFFNLLKNQNPTITEMVWTLDRFVVKNSKYGQLLRDNREMFLSAGVYESFGGYARQQLMRIKGGLDKLTDEDKIDHLKHTAEGLIRNFPKKYTEAGNGIMMINNVFTLENGKQNIDMKIQYDSISLTQINGMMSEIHQTMNTYNKMGNRNRKPAEKLTKHAMHLLRLLISGIEVLETGVLNVYREKDREFLIGVRNDQYSWDEIFEMVAEYQEKLKTASKNTALPPAIDEVKVEKLYREIMLELYAS